MSATLMTFDGDTVDAIAQRVYGFTTGTTEALLDANPGLAARGPVLEAGIVVVLPSLPPRARQAPITRLWD